MGHEVSLLFDYRVVAFCLLLHLGFPQTQNASGTEGKTHIQLGMGDAHLDRFTTAILTADGPQAPFTFPFLVSLGEFVF